MSFYLKDPQSRVDYAIDWTGAGEAIADSFWTIAPEEIGGIVVEAASFGPDRSTARLAGGLVGHIYRIGNRVTLADGRVDERSITLRVEDK